MTSTTAASRTDPAALPAAQAALPAAHAALPPTAAALPAARLLTSALARVLLSAFATLTSFYVLLSVVPLDVRATGGGTGGAGLATGALLLSAVVAEASAPGLIRRYGSRMVLGLGAALLGAPTLVLLASGQLATIVAVSLLRGLGFGLTGVATGVLIAELVPASRRGEGIGLSGVAESIPAIVALPGGVWLAGHAGYPVVIWIAAMAAICPLAVLSGLPRQSRQRQSRQQRQSCQQRQSRQAIESRKTGDTRELREPRGHDGGTPGQRLLDGWREAGLRRPFLVFLAATMPAGAVAAFLPLALARSGDAAALGLLAQAVAATASRWWAGRMGDRHGHARLLVPGALATAAGIAALIWVTSPAAMYAGMCLFGTGFGMLESATFTLMIERVPAPAYGTASALWNLAYDAGYGAGPVFLGAAAGFIGYPACFGLTALVACAAVLPAWRDRATTRAQNPVSEWRGAVVPGLRSEGRATREGATPLGAPERAGDTARAASATPGAPVRQLPTSIQNDSGPGRSSQRTRRAAPRRRASSPGR